LVVAGTLPVLVIYGDRDTSTGPPEPSVEIIRRGLEAAGQANVTVRIFRDADHSLCRAGPARRPIGAASSKERSSDTGPNFTPGYLETVTDLLSNAACTSK
jgi:pimeloyl-ACP methyl ester carboxylesterase